MTYRTSLLLCIFVTVLSTNLGALTDPLPKPDYRRDVDCSADYGKANEWDGGGGGGFVEGCHPKVCNRLV